MLAVVCVHRRDCSLSVLSWLAIPFHLIFKEVKKWKYFSIQCFLVNERGVLFEGAQASSFPLFGKSCSVMEVSMEIWWNDIDRRKSKYW
jgi:hypothetical protein